MKTILRISGILLAAALVAMAFSLAVNNLLAASGFSEGGQPPALTGNASGSTLQPAARPEGGDRDSGSSTRGLVEVFGTLAKLTGIVALVLLIQKAFSLPGSRRLISSSH